MFFRSVCLFVVGSAFWLLLLTAGGCGGWGFGTKLEFNGGEVYYTSAVTEAEATRLGEYLVKGRFFDGSRKSVQLIKQGDVYQFRVVVKAGVDEDAGLVEIFRQIGVAVSKDVFDGAAVEVHLCNDRLKTLKVISANS